MMASRLSRTIILKEGFLFKKGGIMKSWSRRYFVLSPQSLCYFRSESHEKLEPLGRIFLSDIVSISTEGSEKKKAFVFVLHTKKRAVLLQGANTEDRDRWVQMIKQSLEIDKEAEKKDPFRKSLRRLTPGIKRVTIFKDPHKGIGCTIKNAAGHIFVHRIIEDGPIAETGILRPGDELLDVHGTPVTGLSVAEVVEIIHDSPTEFLATVRPVTSVHKALKKDFGRINYADIVHFKSDSNGSTNGSSHAVTNGDSNEDSSEYATIRDTEKRANNHSRSPPLPPRPHNDKSHLLQPQPSFEDVGNYDDEEEGDVPPPLPPWTEDALILVDPPPLSQKPKFNIYKTNAHLGNPSRFTQSPLRNPPKHSYFTESHPSSLSQQFSTPSHYSPPHRLPPARPPKLYKSHSQGDGLDRIDSPPPIPPPRPQRNPLGFFSPAARPRKSHPYEDVDTKKTPNYIDLEFTRKKPKY